MAGQKISGTISYVLEKEYPGAEKIVLELTGKERYIWEGSDDKHKSGKHSGKICIKQTTLRLNQVIHTFEKGKAESGKNAFPFTIQLPNELPPSFLYVGEEGAELRTVYKLTARLGKLSGLDAASSSNGYGGSAD